MEKEINLDNNREKEKLKIPCQNSLENENELKTGISYLSKNSISTNASLLNNSINSKVENSFLKECINKEDKIPTFQINIKVSYEEEEKSIQKKMNNIKDKSLCDYQKREKVLLENETNTQEIDNINEFPIILDAIQNYSNSINNYSKGIIKEWPSIYNSIESVKFNNMEINNRTRVDIKNISLYSEGENRNKFNRCRSQFYIKNNLADNALYDSNDALKPEKWYINDNLFGFLYRDDLITFCISKSCFLGDNNGIDESIKGNLDIECGIFFCGKEFTIENEKKICKKNEFICGWCMENTKKRYKIKKTYLINIKGRVSKINNKSYHCFGHFLKGTQIEDCIKFSCNGCKMLDKYSEYYKKFS